MGPPAGYRCTDVVLSATVTEFSVAMAGRKQALAASPQSARLPLFSSFWFGWEAQAKLHGLITGTKGPKVYSRRCWQPGRPPAKLAMAAAAATQPSPAV